MEYIEVSAETVEAAITKATVDLGLTSDMIDIQVISEGNAGFLGFGKKPAVIKVCKKADLEEEERALKRAEEEAKKQAQREAQREAQKEAKKAARKEKEARKEETALAGTEEKPSNKGQKKSEKKPEKKKNPQNQKARAEEGKKPVKERKIPQKTDEEIEKMKADAEYFLQGIFKAMDIETGIVMTYDKEEGCLNAEFTGEDMGVLIGKRGQTLDSLQYLTSLVINKENKDEYVRVKLDTEDYRRRRKETLENLAKNIANKVKKTGKTVVLEPMNPYERRIIHSALQPNKSVETFSEGTEPYRHVVVKPVRQR
jgi:spoIIIJ-associated protein